MSTNTGGACIAIAFVCGVGKDIGVKTHVRLLLGPSSGKICRLLSFPLS
jgi:hypothetical protein